MKSNNHKSSEAKIPTVASGGHKGDHTKETKEEGRSDEETKGDGTKRRRDDETPQIG